MQCTLELQKNKNQDTFRMSKWGETRLYIVQFCTLRIDEMNKLRKIMNLMTMIKLVPGELKLRLRYQVKGSAFAYQDTQFSN